MFGCFTTCAGGSLGPEPQRQFRLTSGRDDGAYGLMSCTVMGHFSIAGLILSSSMRGNWSAPLLSRRSRQFDRWLKGLTAGDGSVYRWLRGQQPQTVVPCNGRGVPLCYAEALDLRAGQFTDVWKSDGLDPDSIQWPEPLRHVDSLPSPDELRDTAVTFPCSTAYGVDAVHPRQLALLSDALLWKLLAIWLAMLRSGHVPRCVAFVVISLLPKPAGGDRPVGLFASVVRVVDPFLRRTYGARFLRNKIPCHWYGVKGKCTQQAAWTRLTAARMASLRVLGVNAFLFDITKAFDILKLDVVFEALVGELGFDPCLLRLPFCPICHAACGDCWQSSGQEVLPSVLHCGRLRFC